MNLSKTLHEIVDGAAVKQRNPPEHIPDQRDRIHDLFDTDEAVWMLFLDAGRYDMFDQLVWDYFDGHLTRAWNGGVGYTGDWAVRNLQYDFGKRGLFAQLPLRDLQHADYDGRQHFATVAGQQANQTASERLAALGYLPDSDPVWSSPPQRLNRTVLAECGRLNGGVVRYLKPHPPFAGLGDITSGDKTATTSAALDDGQVTHKELVSAYRETYRIGLEAAAELVPELPGKVILTADHGTCLTCGQLFHGRQLDKHDHLTTVPWFEVDQTL